jgi:formylglycine-generating enzyme required for sulfatase activity
MGINLQTPAAMRSRPLPFALAAVSLPLVLALAGCSMGGEEEGGPGSSLTGANGVGSSGSSSSGANAEPAPTPTDGKKNGTETDADCGGANAPKCADGKACKDAGDCESGVCGGGTCAVPTGTDGVKNGDETDVDCGGTKTGAPKCEATKACAAHSDCASDGCGYDKKCALAPSCAAHFGGDTCGAGEVGEAGAEHESCCATAEIPGNATMVLDKYVVTAGRFRQFVERTNGNLKGFAESLGNANPDWNASWNDMLPSNVAETNFYLGPTGHGPRAGCDLGDSSGRTYWMSDAENQALGETGTHPFTKDILDQKALNCVEFYMLQAFCIWDGGRLAKQAEFKAAWQGGENRVYPWGNALDNSKMNWKYSYSFPEEYDKGNFVFVGAPGRFPEGNSKTGHSDLAGLVFEWLSDVSGTKATWSGSGSWEGHGVMADAVSYGLTEGTRAYWAAGGRCARPAQ